HPAQVAARSGAKALRSWRRAPAFDCAMVAVVSMIASAMYFGPMIASRNPVRTSSSVMAAIAERATVDLTEDFHSGLDAWSGKPGWKGSWSVDPSGWVQPGRLALSTATVPLDDSRVVFMGQIKTKA